MVSCIHFSLLLIFLFGSFVVSVFVTHSRCAVVTGANRGLGFAICRQLAASGVVVVLTARDENRGIQAVDDLKTNHGVSSDNIVYHQLDVTDSSSISSLADFIKTQFGKLDILVGTTPNLTSSVTTPFDPRSYV
ncbi:unnamed protein product [Linum tenue]|uniref:(+)-neomenthol dehydrogenase-like n=1 Tax=Linum tenue TaxID=586396 RepID=A0AAV0H5N6_9ROSI|nr:unnamed protein product [Linum tenue]